MLLRRCFRYIADQGLVGRAEWQRAAGRGLLPKRLRFGTSSTESLGVWWRHSSAVVRLGAGRRYGACTSGLGDWERLETGDDFEV